MLKKIQLPLSIVLLVVMVFVWKSVLDRFFPHLLSGSAPTVLTAVKVRGEVTMEIGDKAFAVKEGQVIDKPVSLSTAPNSLVILGYGEGFASKIKIGPNSKLDLSKFKMEGSYSSYGLFIDLSAGRLLLKIFNPNKQKILKVKTPNFSMGVRGTTFIVEANEERSLLLVKEGSVEVESKTGKPKMANAGHGFVSQNNSEVQPIQISDYNLDWDVESTSTTPQITQTSPTSQTPPPPTPAVDISQLNIPLVIEAEVRKMQARLDELQNTLPTKIQQFKEQDQKYESELDQMAQDESCLQNNFKDCEFTSESFKNHPSNLKNNPAHLSLNANSRASLEKEFAKAKEDVLKKKNDLKAESDVAENEVQVEKEKLKTATEKFEQYKAADETTKKGLLKEISELLDSTILREAANGDQ